jgi:hypothetical protein
MPVYYVNEAAFELPAIPLVDRTLHRLESPLVGSSEPVSLEIRRLPVEPGKSLRERIDDEVATSRRDVSGWSLVEEHETSIDGHPAIVQRARLRARDEVYLEHKAHVVHGDTWLTFVVTGPSSARAACEETFGRVVEQLRFRNP